MFGSAGILMEVYSKADVNALAGSVCLISHVIKMEAMAERQLHFCCHQLHGQS